MTLVDDLDRLVTTGALARTGMVNADMYSFTGPLGEYGGEAFTVAVSVFAYDTGAIRTHGETWLGDHRVLLPPLEANWPAVKAMRELDADLGDIEDVTRRLLAAVLPRNAVPEGLGLHALA